MQHSEEILAGNETNEGEKEERKELLFFFKKKRSETALCFRLGWGQFSPHSSNSEALWQTAKWGSVSSCCSMAAIETQSTVRSPATLKLTLTLHRVAWCHWLSHICDLICWIGLFVLPAMEILMAQSSERWGVGWGTGRNLSSPSGTSVSVCWKTQRKTTSH